MNLSNPWLSRLLRLSAVAMLFAILAHATIPIGAPFERHSGSVFSATTSETTVDISRPAQVRKLPAAKMPGGDPDLLIPVLLLAVFLVVAGRLAAIGFVRRQPQLINRRPRQLRPDMGSRAPPTFS